MIVRVEVPSSIQLPISPVQIVVTRMHCIACMQGLPVQEAGSLEDRQAFERLPRGAKPVSLTVGFGSFAFNFHIDAVAISPSH